MKASAAEDSALIRLRFEKGSILATGGTVLYGVHDPLTSADCAPALRYREILGDLRRRGVEYRDEAFRPLPCPKLSSRLELRDYQVKALDAWKRDGCRGIIVLPTGAGKTVIALKAIEELGLATLVARARWRTKY